ncbi:hypothetical protein BX600DRAFT_525761 [Xylariales sp. PMI_506]|nr:hypothetical protein BX600DRAFT_525761 [Xylariales sp. PMI_506]
MQECLRLRTNKIGPNHPDTISSTNVLSAWGAEGVDSSLQPSRDDEYQSRYF